MSRPRRATVAVLVLAAMVVAACGQKSGVHVSANGVGAGAQGGSTGGATLGLGSTSSGSATGTATSGTATGGGTTSGTTAAGTTGGATPSGATAGTTTAGTTGTGGGSATSTGATSTGGGAGTGTTSGGTTAGTAGSTVGVSDTEIRIGIHAPATGAGAPQTSFDQEKDLYFKYIGNGINGRHVTVFFEDDKYNPSSAVQACQKLVQQDHVFLLLGGGGADQIAACAKYAASVGVPYLAEGVGEAGLASLSGYYALSMTYKQQGPLLAQYIKNVVKKLKVAMVRANTGNFEDGHQGFLDGVHQQGLQLVADEAMAKDASAGEVQAAAAQVCSKRPDVVYPLMSPALFLQFASAMKAQACSPRYAGVGVTIGLNVVAQVACPAQTVTGGASFFSPFTGLDQANALDPHYQATARANGAAGDDIGWALWGADKLVSQMLTAGGRNLTRQSFVAAVKGKRFSTHTYPDVDYATGPFGGTAVHVLKVDCSKQQYVTEFAFKSAF
jgi:branched-chain amino acid transport system substrate-binding protein